MSLCIGLRYLSVLQATPAAPTAAMVEAAEEAKLRSKYPKYPPMAGHSAFLQKRLTKGVSMHTGTCCNP